MESDILFDRMSHPEGPNPFTLSRDTYWLRSQGFDNLRIL